MSLDGLSGKKVLVTGGAGFIGFHLINRLLDLGAEVVCIDNLNDYYDKNLKMARLAEIKDKITFYEDDIVDRVALERIFKEHRLDAVCHLAAQAGVRYSLEHPEAYVESNYIGTFNVIDLAKKYNVERLVAASTSSIYGGNERMPFKETDQVDNPLSIYAATKRGVELVGSNYCHLYDMNITFLRFFTVYGPWGRPDMALFLFTDAILSDRPIDVFNHGNMSRDFTYVTDIVEGFVLALAKPNGFQIYNLGNGKPESLESYIDEIERVLDKKAKRNMLPMQPGDVQKTWADISKAKDELDFTPQVTIHTGVEKFIAWYRDYYNR